MISNECVHTFLVTRFNIAVNYKSQKANTSIPDDKPWLDEEYLRKRFDIFEKYTFPSVMKQSDMDFSWIILFHKDTPNQFMERIDEFSKKMPNIATWFLNDDDSYRALELISEYFDRIQREDKTRIISCRIDNDDMIGRDYVKEVKIRLQKENGRRFLSFSRGISYQISNHYVASFIDVGNHFLAMISDNGRPNFITAAGDHDRVMKDCSNEERIVVNTDMPMWVEIISDTNCLNRVRWSGKEGFFLPYSLAKEYPELGLWNNWISYLFSTLFAPIYYFSHKFLLIAKYGHEWRKN